MKKSFFMLLILFICGIVSADVCMDILKEGNALLDVGMYERYANAQLVYQDIFWNILYERIKLFAFLLLLCFTPIRRFLGIVMISVFSFTWGFYIMTCVLELGMAGVIVGIAAVLPQGILYGMLLITLLSRNDVHTYSHHKQSSLVRGILDVVIVILLLITGCVMESIVSTHFIPWVIRLSMI